MISVVIRTRNECSNLKVCLKRLSKQTIHHEVIIVDSYSKDDTVKVSEEYGCKVVQCDDFTFGRALNMGIQVSKGSFIGILSGHCFPTNDTFLEVLMNNLFNEKIAGVYARQIPHRDTNPLEYRNFIYTYRLEAEIQRRCPFFNNAASMIRKELWDIVKFDEEVAAQEDIIWAREMQRLGYCIAYEPNAIVEHLHNEDTIDTVNRYVREYNVLKKMGVRLCS